MAFDLRGSLRVFRENNRRFPAGQRILNVFDSALCAVLYRCDFSSYFSLRFAQKRGCLRRTYLTQEQARRLERLYNTDADQRALLRSKSRFNAFMSEYVRRGWLDASVCAPEELFRFAAGKDALIVKPLDLNQGRGVHKLRPADFENDPEGFWDAVKGNLVEDVIVQHPALAAFNPASVNSLRILTVRTGDTVTALAAALKMGGSADSCVDNLHASGGLCGQVDMKTGVVYTPGQDLHTQRHIYHPATGVQIPGFRVPHWDEAVRTVCRAALRLDGLALIGWDVAITPEGCEIIEGNTGSGIHLVQMCDDRGGIRPALLKLLKDNKFKGIRHA